MVDFIEFNMRLKNTILFIANSRFKRKITIDVEDNVISIYIKYKKLHHLKIYNEI